MREGYKHAAPTRIAFLFPYVLLLFPGGASAQQISCATSSVCDSVILGSESLFQRGSPALSDVQGMPIVPAYLDKEKPRPFNHPPSNEEVAQESGSDDTVWTGFPAQAGSDSAVWDGFLNLFASRSDLAETAPEESAEETGSSKKGQAVASAVPTPPPHIWDSPASIRWWRMQNGYPENSDVSTGSQTSPPEAPPHVDPCLYAASETPGCINTEPTSTSSMHMDRRRNVILALLILVILFLICFNTMHHWWSHGTAAHKTDEYTHKMVNALCKELTIVGIIALASSSLIRMGVMHPLSERFLGQHSDEAHSSIEDVRSGHRISELSVLVEDVHLLLFCMAMSLLAGCVLNMLFFKKTMAAWRDAERLIEEHGGSMASALGELVRLYQTAGIGGFYKVGAYRMQIRYLIFRSEFLHPTGAQPPLGVSIETFSFLEYLEMCCGEQFVEQAEIPGWCFFLCLVVAVVLRPLYGWSGLAIVQVFLAMAAVLMLSLVFIQMKLYWIESQLMPDAEHIRGKGLKSAVTATQTEVQRTKPFRARLIPDREQGSWLRDLLWGSGVPTAHEHLFWFHRNGPAFLWFCFRMLFVLSALLVGEFVSHVLTYRYTWMRYWVCSLVFLLMVVIICCLYQECVVKTVLFTSTELMVRRDIIEKINSRNHARAKQQHAKLLAYIKPLAVQRNLKQQASTQFAGWLRRFEMLPPSTAAHLRSLWTWATCESKFPIKISQHVFWRTVPRMGEPWTAVLDAGNPESLTWFQCCSKDGMFLSKEEFYALATGVLESLSCPLREAEAVKELVSLRAGQGQGGSLRSYDGCQPSLFDTMTLMGLLNQAKVLLPPKVGAPGDWQARDLMRSIFDHDRRPGEVMHLYWAASPEGIVRYLVQVDRELNIQDDFILTEWHLREIFDRCDLDGDGLVRLEELIAACAASPEVAGFFESLRACKKAGGHGMASVALDGPNQKTDNGLTACFDSLDADRDGSLTWFELRNFYLHDGEKVVACLDSWSVASFSDYADNDGTLSRQTSRSRELCTSDADEAITMSASGIQSLKSAESLIFFHSSPSLGQNLQKIEEAPREVESGPTSFRSQTPMTHHQYSFADTDNMTRSKTTPKVFVAPLYHDADDMSPGLAYSAARATTIYVASVYHTTSMAFDFANESDDQKFRRLLLQWDLPHGPRHVAASAFARVDINRDGRLKWNNGEIKQFIVHILHHYQIRVPVWKESVWYEMYRRCDVDGSYSIDLEECYSFARLVFEEGLRLLTQRQDNDVEKLRRLLAQWDLPNGPRLVALSIFARVDGNRDRMLTWNNGEIRRFVSEIFHHYQVSAPIWQEHIWYDMYRFCDVDGSYSIDMEECYNFAKLCFQETLRMRTQDGGSDEEKLRLILDQWDAPGDANREGPQAVIASTFARVDANHDGHLNWNNGEIKQFIGSMFRHYLVAVPPWQEHVWYDMYRGCDVDGSYSIQLQECSNFAKLCLQETLRLRTQEVQCRSASAVPLVAYIYPQPILFQILRPSEPPEASGLSASAGRQEERWSVSELLAEAEAAAPRVLRLKRKKQKGWC